MLTQEEITPYVALMAAVIEQAAEDINKVRNTDHLGELRRLERERAIQWVKNRSPKAIETWNSFPSMCSYVGIDPDAAREKILRGETISLAAQRKTRRLRPRDQQRRNKRYY